MSKDLKPSRKTEIRRVEYWECLNPSHRHRSCSVAASCMEKQKKRESKPPGARTWTSAAYQEVLIAYRSGSRKCDIARSLGLSSQRIREVIAKAERLEKNGITDDVFQGLSERIKNCLRAGGWVSPALARKALDAGLLDKTPNFGVVSRQQLKEWLDSTNKVAV